MRTKDEILDKMFEVMPYQMIGKEQLLPYIKEAMEIYAQEQVKNCSIPNVVGQSTKCKGCDGSSGETKLWCCNHCGKRVEDF